MTLELKATKSSVPGRRITSPAYHVMEGEVVVGRIYQADRAWIWTLYTNRARGSVPPGGRVPMLEQARKGFKEAWKANNHVRPRRRKNSARESKIMVTLPRI